MSVERKNNQHDSNEQDKKEIKISAPNGILIKMTLHDNKEQG
jgi:hypothetical protein